MSALDRLKDGLINKGVVASIPDSSNHGVHGSSIVGFSLDKIERAAYATGFGFIKGRFREKSLIADTIPTDIAVGGLMTVLSGILNAVTEGKSNLAKHTERLGDAGVMSFFNSLGASWGAQSADYQVAVVPKTAKLPPGSAPMVLGALSQAADGAYLTAEEIAKYSVAK